MNVLQNSVKIILELSPKSLIPEGITEACLDVCPVTLLPVTSFIHYKD